MMGLPAAGLRIESTGFSAADWWLWCRSMMNLPAAGLYVASRRTLGGWEMLVVGHTAAKNCARLHEDGLSCCWDIQLSVVKAGLQETEHRAVGCSLLLFVVWRS